MKHLATLTLAMISGLSGLAHAEDGVQWHVLGPAFSHHFGKNVTDGAQIIEPEHLVTTCPSIQLGINNGGICKTELVPAKTAFNETNTAIGVERVREGSDFSQYAMIVKDSYSEFGVMAGVRYQPLSAVVGSVKMSLGLAGGLWYRTVANYKASSAPITRCDNSGFCYAYNETIVTTEMSRRVIPFAMPVMTIGSVSGKGARLNLALIPKMTVGEIVVAPVTTLMGQLSYGF